MIKNEGSLFLGLIQKKFRSFLTATLKKYADSHNCLFDVNGGTFTIALCALSAGWKPEKIHISDVCLYTSIIGYHITGQSIADLGVKINDSLHDGIVTDPAEILTRLKLYSIKPKNSYIKQFRDEMELNYQSYKSQIQESLDGFRQKLNGISYEIRDMWDVMKQESENEQAIIHVDPPGSKNGYKNQYDTNGIITWNEPEFTVFNPREGKELICQYAKAAKSFYLIRNFRTIPETKLHIVCGIDSGKGLEDFYLSNRNLPDKPIYKRKETKLVPLKIKLFSDDDRITETSVISFRIIRKENAMYYRDLFTHRLGTTTAEMFLMMLIDGKITSISGFMISDWEMKGWDNIYENFGFSVRPILYPRINKLHMMCLTSVETANFIKKSRKYVNYKPLINFRTTCLTKHHEQKGNRGVLKIESREILKNGLFRIVYYTPFKPESWNEMKLKFLQREGYDAETGERTKAHSDATE